jgi:hypothetical protein
MLFTQKDRETYRLRLEIEKVEQWLADDANDRRATAFHKAKLAQLRAEMEKLED